MKKLISILFLLIVSKMNAQTAQYSIGDTSNFIKMEGYRPDPLLNFKKDSLPIFFRFNKNPDLSPTDSIIYRVKLYKVLLVNKIPIFTDTLEVEIKNNNTDKEEVIFINTKKEVNDKNLINITMIYSEISFSDGVADTFSIRIGIPVIFYNLFFNNKLIENNTESVIAYTKQQQNSITFKSNRVAQSWFQIYSKDTIHIEDARDSIILKNIDFFKIYITLDFGSSSIGVFDSLKINILQEKPEIFSKRFNDSVMITSNYSGYEKKFLMYSNNQKEKLDTSYSVFEKDTIYAKGNCKIILKTFQESDTIEINDFTSTSKDVYSKTLNFEIYPNPSSDFIFIKSEDEKFEINIIDFKGTLVKKCFNQNKISIETLPRGTYLLVLKQKEKILSKKIVLQ